MTPGHYRTRFIKHGPWYGALIWRPCPLEMRPDYWQWCDRWPALVVNVAGRILTGRLDLLEIQFPDINRRPWFPAYEKYPNLLPCSRDECLELLETMPSPWPAPNILREELPI